MHTETISIGSELASGATVDTNASWLARQLARLGLAVARHATLPDAMAPLVAHLRALRALPQQPTMVILSGGLGPTLDDITREAVAEAFDAPLLEDTDCRRVIEEIFRKRGWNFAASNLRQALIPTGATVLPNPRGTAPGFYLVRDDVHLFSMPGVPSEMFGMFTEQVAPRLRQLTGGGAVILERVLHTFGLGESTVGEKIAVHMARGRNPEVGTTVADGLVSVRVRARAATEAEALAMLDLESTALAALLGEIHVGTDDDRLPQVVARLLAACHETLAVAESCTGGLLSKMITDVPGASAFFIEAAVTYADRAKTALLGVPADLIRQHGAVSEPVARAMVEGMKSAARTTYALSVTGIAGPTGGTPTKPVGLVFLALSGPRGTTAAQLNLPGDRDRIRQRAALAALNLLRLELLK